MASGETNPADDPADWPVDLRGVTESVVTTLGPNGLWNAAALGVHEGNPATARTWGDTRTRRNFHREGGGVVQFLDDPVVFVEAALAIHEAEEPVLEEALAWVEAEAEQIDSGEDGGTRWEEWELRPVEAAVERETVPTINRGFNAVVEATVAASRLGVEGFDDEALRKQLAYFEGVVEKCGGEREREAMEKIVDSSE